MSVFGLYSQYYDLLYKDKDYFSEVEYIEEIIKKYNPGSTEVLDLGCGTGRHIELLSQKGYSVHGVDLSDEMLKVARQRCEIKNTFYQGDVRSFQLGFRVDVVMSLFHVFSYQSTNKDLEQTLLRVKEHLKPGGVLIFDCWYGPAVLTEKPQSRIKRLENEHISVVRRAKPIMHVNDNCVDVNYRISITDKHSGSIQELSECHRMRYLFKPEVELFFKMTGLKMLACMEWLTNREPGINTWGVCFVGKNEGV